ncbi:MAG: response regulator [Cyanobacteria bacterium P01_F01_bin.13]
MAMFDDSDPPILLPGESVLYATSALEAIDCIKTMEPPMGFILDLNMTGMNGLDVLKYIRSQPTLSDAPVVIYSSSDNPDDRRRCEEAGANDYVKKSDDLDVSEMELARILKVFRSYADTRADNDSSLGDMMRRALGD